MKRRLPPPYKTFCRPTRAISLAVQQTRKRVTNCPGAARLDPVLSSSPAPPKGTVRPQLSVPWHVWRTGAAFRGISIGSWLRFGLLTANRHGRRAIQYGRCRSSALTPKILNPFLPTTHLFCRSPRRRGAGAVESVTQHLFCVARIRQKSLACFLWQAIRCCCGETACRSEARVSAGPEPLCEHSLAGGRQISDRALSRSVASAFHR